MKLWKSFFYQTKILTIADSYTGFGALMQLWCNYSLPMMQWSPRSCNHPCELRTYSTVSLCRRVFSRPHRHQQDNISSVCFTCALRRVSSSCCWVKCSCVFIRGDCCMWYKSVDTDNRAWTVALLPLCNTHTSYGFVCATVDTASVLAHVCVIELV